ncbi:uncharacterized protein PRCAT00005636001 [Priceomyces carsonii]|uniref:uncharacterized protein n=1 Tax=Priceomyces carsonii TaxID=28549 RepID=UPI002EDA4DD8|nr:unnamed protein product [Priceomyces carsonii]
MKESKYVSRAVALPLIILLITSILVARLNVIELFQSYSVNIYQPSENSNDNRLFTDFVFDPAERFNIHENIKYGWIVVVIGIILLAVLLN